MKKAFYLIFLSFCYLTAYAQRELELRTNTPEFEDQFFSVICDDAGSLYCTYIKENSLGLPSEYEQSYLLKVDPEGDTTLIDYSVSDSLFRLVDIYIDSDNTFVLFGDGWRIDTIEGVSDPYHYFIKLNNELEIIWKKGFHLESANYITVSCDLIEKQNGNYVFSATVLTIPPPYTGSFFFFELSKEGDSLDFTLMEDEYTGLMSCLSLKNNSNNLFCHMELGVPPPSGDISKCKRLELSDENDFVSLTPYPSRDYTGPFHTMNYEQEHFLSFGTYWELIEGQKDRNYYLNARLLDSSLNIVHQVSLTDPETKAYTAWFRCVDYYYPERIFVVGADKVETSLSFPESTDYIYIACLDENLNLINEEFLESENDFYLINSMCATPDGGVAIAGGVYNFNYNNYKYDGYLLKLDSLQFVGINDIKSTGKSNHVKIFPNPAKSTFKIYSDINPITFQMFDITGKKHFDKTLYLKETDFDISELSSGIYFWRAENIEFNEHGLFIKY